MREVVDQWWSEWVELVARWCADEIDDDQFQDLARALEMDIAAEQMIRSARNYARLMS